ncbi:hypothetical protein [Microbispora sp. NPDC049125]|uniref:hypothetical protein n=1 Tax=Microbispora sp. NPDC049125 TaxID=3154929 RepID=UPI0034673095
MPTITESRALVRVEQLIRDTAADLRPVPTLELIPFMATPSRCPDHPAGYDAELVVTRAYWLNGIDAGHMMAVAQQVRASWERQGHVLTATGDLAAGHPDLAGQTRPDGFVLALVWAEGDRLYLAATSPCVRPDRDRSP